jgi:hypothetical protein
MDDIGLWSVILSIAALLMGTFGYLVVRKIAKSEEEWWRKIQP